MTRACRGWCDGWRLVMVLTAILVLLSIWIASMRGFEVEGVRMVIRFTARASLLFFCLAFAASAAATLWPASATRWLRQNRRYIGLSFAMSHALHAIAIVCFAIMAPAAYAAATTPASYVFGGIGYAFIIAMAATSFDRTAATIGPRAWRILHSVGIYYLWFQFAVSFGMRIPQMPNYVWFLVPLLAVMTIRIVAAVVKRRRAGALSMSSN